MLKKQNQTLMYEKSFGLKEINTSNNKLTAWWKICITLTMLLVSCDLIFK